MEGSHFISLTAEVVMIWIYFQLMRRNRKERAEERIHMEPDMIDGQMLWMLMQHLRRSARRRVS